jgi:hypothetical protein
MLFAGTLRRVTVSFPYRAALKGKYMSLILVKIFIPNVPSLLLLNLKYLQILSCVSFVNIYSVCSRGTYILK